MSKDKKISCECCDKTAKLRNAKAWAKLSIITEGEEMKPIYFCSYSCFVVWFKQENSQKYF